MVGPPHLSLSLITEEITYSVGVCVWLVVHVFSFLFSAYHFWGVFLIRCLCFVPLHVHPLLHLRHMCEAEHFMLLLVT